MGDNTVKASRSPAVYVPPSAALTLSGDVALTASTSDKYLAAIGSGYRENSGKILILSGTVNASSGTYGAGIGGGDQGSGTVTISSDTVTASAQRGAGIGGGSSGSGTVTVNGGNVKASSTRGGRVSSPTDGGGNAVSLVTLTLPGDMVTNATPITAVTGIGSYGIHDVYPLDGNKLYFYLPANTLPEKIQAAGREFVPDGDGSTNYILNFAVTLTGSYPLSRTYDGTALENPTPAQVTCAEDYGNLTFTWLQNGAALSAPPADAGEYVLRISN